MAASSTPAPTPWTIKTVNQLTEQLAILGSDGTIVVTFPSPATSSALINGILTKVFTTSGAMQSTLNLANAQFIVGMVNQQAAILDTLSKLQTAIDPSFNRVMPVSALRKATFTAIGSAIQSIQGTK